MISRDEAIEKLKSLWQVTEFTFLARFDVPISQQEIDGPDAFGFFKELHWNKKRLFFPSEEESIKRNSASCYAKKAGLKHNSYYIITAELSPDDKRKKNPYALYLTYAREATQDEIDEHRSNFVRKEKVFLAYVNFVAYDKSHAYVKVVEKPSIKNIKDSIENNEKGQKISSYSGNISKGQIVVVKKTNRLNEVRLVSDVFRGKLCNGHTFIDLDTLSGSLSLNVSLSIGFDNDELESYNSRINCAVNIYDSSPGFTIEKIETEEDLVLSDLDEFVNKNIQELLNSELTDYDFNNKTKFLEKIDADFRNKIAEVFQQDWEIIASNSEENVISEFLIKWTKKYPEIVLFSNLRSVEFSRLFIKMWQENKLPINFFEGQLFNAFVNNVTSGQISYEAFLSEIHPNGFALLKTKFLDILDTPISIESIEVYFTMERLLHDFSLTEEQKKNAFQIMKSSVTDKVLSDLDEFVNKNIQDLFISELTDYDFNSRTKFLEKVDPNFRNKIAEIFQKEWENKASNAEENVISEFLVKWKNKYPEIVLFSNLRSIEYSSLFMKLWQENQLPINFFEDQLIIIFINHIVSEHISTEEFLIELHPNGLGLLKTKFLETLDTPISIESIEIYSIMERLLLDFSLTEDQKENAFHIIQSSVTDEVQFELWKENKIDNFPILIAYSNFDLLDAQQQELVIFEIEDEDLIPLLDKIKPTDSARVNERIENLNQQFILEKFGFIVFDIESDTNKIYELAWSNGNHIENFINQEVEFGISQFKEDSKNKVLVGHNIIDFDLPILGKIEDFNYDVNFVWDTLSVEKVLSPELKTYALNTKHAAKEDVNHTLGLFKNQFLRVLKLTKDKIQILEGILPKEVLSKVSTLSEDYQFDISLTTLNESKVAFFRPQPKTNPLIKDLIGLIGNSDITSKIILADESMVSDLLSYGKINFTEKFLDKIDFQIISSNKVNDFNQLDDLQRLQLNCFFDLCKQMETIPYWGNVSPSIRNEIEGVMDVWALFGDNKIQITTYPLFISSDELESISLLSIETSNSELFIIQPNLISITQKRLIKQIDIEQLKVVFQENYFWMKFSGGQSVVNIPKNDVQILVSENLDSYDNFWIEKYQYGKYRIYANKNWEDEISKLSFKQVSRIELDQEQFKSDQVISVKFKPNKNGEYNVTRFNPESIYRSRYWVIQKKIIDQLVTQGDSLLLVQRSEEINDLTKYFESEGYYIPSDEIGLGRRLELLHSNKRRDKIIIININEADRILKLNHSFPINLIVDSFNLIDSYYCSFGTSFFNEKKNEGIYKNESDLTITSDEEESEFTDVGFAKSNENFLKDSFFLLKLLRPKINSLRNLLRLNNMENKMWLLDPRIDDYKELSKHWNITRQFVASWENKEEFESDVLKAESFITSPKPLEIPFTEDESIEIIRNVFISGYQWKPEQIPYLKEILKSKEDWLINLPTGMGKSVLFQGPALLKSAFSNRLTIVITPLKALMEDHVNSLWTRGFFGCVDYLNSDRSSDTELIYRSIAGGEMSLLFITPERFRSRGFLNAIDARIQSDGGLEYFVFDEAHCVSQWGHDFRPDYFNCAKQVWRTKMVSNYPTPLLLFSATVSEKIYQDFNTIFS